MSEIHVIGNERFRKVKREASVGERVLIVNALDGVKDVFGYDNGESYEIVSMFGDEPEIEPRGAGGVEGSRVYLEHEEYVVLEPETSSPDDLTETLAQLAVKVAKLEEELTKVKSELRRLVQPPEVCSDNSNDRQLTRGDVIRQAKSDVLALALTRQERVPVLYGGVSTFSPFERGDEVKFVVNREKRTVVALIDGYFAEGDRRIVWARGVAKCAPGDCFNSDIGKAISLRRALGLDVPEEYVNAPQPKEPQVGDVIQISDGSFRTVVEREREVVFGKSCHENSYNALHSVVVDDSRTGTEREDYAI